MRNTNNLVELCNGLADYVLAPIASSTLEYMLQTVSLKRL